MRKILFYILFSFLFQSISSSQTVTEKELLTLNYKGSPDAYSFYYDNKTGNYMYNYYDETDKKSFLIFNTGASVKYDFISIYDGRIDSKGNSYIVSGNYKSDYGIDNNFLLVNGKDKLNYNYIESYSSFVNKNDEFVFIFMINEKYLIGKYSIDKGFQQSEEYESIRSVYKYNENSQKEGDAEGYSENDFFKDENGERCFIGIKNGKANLIFESKIINTEYSDINDASITYNKNNELSYIAKSAGRFYEQQGNEFVVSGNKIYDTFQNVYPPVLFNSNNEPVYSCSDSVSENSNNYYLVIGNEIQTVKNINSSEPVKFTSWIKDLKINADGNITYIGMDEIIIPAKKTDPDIEVYDEYFTKSYFVKNNLASELGYNIGNTKYGSNGNILYSGIADLNKKEYLMIESNGISNIILSNESFDYLSEFGYTPSNEVFYIGQNYANESMNKKTQTKLFVGNELTGTYNYLIYQAISTNSAILKFDSKGNYAFVAEDIDNLSDVNDNVYINNLKLPFPETSVKNISDFSFIRGMFYTLNDKLFYIGEIKISEDKTLREIFVDNISLGKVYDMIGEINYNEKTNEVNFFATKDKSIYKVTVRF
jgi:hypothetical protein